MTCSIIKYVNSIQLADYNLLRKSAGWYEITDKQTQTGLENSTFKVSAVYEGKTVGMARVISDGGYVALIADVIVLPEYQGNGIGKTMMNMVMEYIKSNVAEDEKVFVNLMAAKGRESFYKQFGFVERPDEKLGAGMTQWIIR